MTSAPATCALRLLLAATCWMGAAAIAKEAEPPGLAYALPATCDDGKATASSDGLQQLRATIAKDADFQRYNWAIELAVRADHPPRDMISLRVDGDEPFDLTRYSAFDRPLPNRNLYAQLVCANGDLTRLCPAEQPVDWCARDLGRRTGPIDCRADPQAGTRSATAASYLPRQGPVDLSDSIRWMRDTLDAQQWIGRVSLGLTAYEPGLRIALSMPCRDGQAEPPTARLVRLGERTRLGIVYGEATSLHPVQADSVTHNLVSQGTRLTRVAMGGFDAPARCRDDARADGKRLRDCPQRERLAGVLRDLLQTTEPAPVAVHLRIRPSLEDYLAADRPVARPYRTKHPQREGDEGEDDEQGVAPSIEPDDPRTPYDESAVHRFNLARADERDMCPNTRNFIYSISKINVPLFKARMGRYFRYLRDEVWRDRPHSRPLEAVALFNEINAVCNNGDIFPVPRSAGDHSFDQYARGRPNGEDLLAAARDRQQASVTRYAQLLKALVEVLREPDLAPYFGNTKVLTYSNSLDLNKVRRYAAARNEQASIPLPQHIEPSRFFNAIAKQQLAGRSLSDFIGGVGLNIYPRIDDERDVADDIIRTNVDEIAGFLRQQMDQSGMPASSIWLTELGFHQYRRINAPNPRELRTSEQRFRHYYRAMQAMMNRPDLRIEGVFIYGATPLRNPLMLRTREKEADPARQRPPEGVLPEAEILRYSW